MKKWGSCQRQEDLKPLKESNNNRMTETPCSSIAPSLKHCGSLSFMWCICVWQLMYLCITLWFLFWYYTMVCNACDNELMYLCITIWSSICGIIVILVGCTWIYCIYIDILLEYIIKKKYHKNIPLADTMRTAGGQRSQNSNQPDVPLAAEVA